MFKKKAILVSSLALFATASGCTTTTVTSGGVTIRPDGTPGPQECSEEAKKAMRYMQLRVGDSAWVDLDVNQVNTERITLYDGPIESQLAEELGILRETTRLYGQVWTAGPQVVIRWYEAQPPRSEKVPICAVARLGRGQMKKLPESQPGMAILEGSTAGVYIVDTFR